jgi:hypothetical protein
MIREPRRYFRRSSVAWTLSVALMNALSIAACSSSSDEHPAGIDPGGAGASAVAPGSAGGAFGGSTAVAGENAGASDAVDSGEDDVGGAPGLESDAGPGRPPIGPAACSETATWSGATKLAAVSTDAAESVLSVTSDELDLAFLRGTALYVAHRADKAGTFSVGAVVSIPDGWSAAQGAALSADGKRLVLTSADQTMLGEMTRTTRTASFAGVVDQTAFVAVNQTSEFSGNIFASPVLSPDDQELFLNSGSAGGSSTVVAATRSSGQPWSLPNRVISALDGAAGARRLPTGLSADARTLFYFNEETSREEARWRDEAKLSSPLYDMVDLGTRRGAQPNAGCDHLYSDAAGDIVVEQD